MVEVLVAIMLASITIVALAQALFTLMMTSGTTAVRQDLSTAVSGYTESLRQLDWVPCSGATTPGAQVYADAEASATDPYRPPRGVTLTVTRVEYWNASTATFDSTCPVAGTRAQRLSIRATDAGHAETGQIVKVPW